MKTKALFGLWSEMKVPDINRILKPHGVRLVMKRSKVWGKQVSVTAHPTETVKRVRATPTPLAPIPENNPPEASVNYDAKNPTSPVVIE